jgi:hypothetical protein
MRLITNQRSMSANIPRSKLSAHAQEANPKEIQDVIVAMSQANLKYVSMGSLTHTASI